MTSIIKLLFKKKLFLEPSRELLLETDTVSKSYII